MSPFFIAQSKRLIITFQVLFALCFFQCGSAAFTSATPVSNQSEIEKNNWSGQMLDRGPYTMIRADWTVPCLVQDPNNSDHQTESTSIWIGLGGVAVDSAGKKKNLVQLGTGSDLSYDAQGNAHSDNYAWIENLGLPPPNNRMKKVVEHIPCGHHIHAEFLAPNEALGRPLAYYSIVDLNGGPKDRFEKELPGPAPDMSTAEFIVERPKLPDGTTLGLAPFPDITMWNCAVFAASNLAEIRLSAENTKTIRMVDDKRNNKPMAQVLPIRNADASFTVKWLSAGLLPTGLKLKVNGTYYTTDQTENNHLQMRIKRDKVVLEATWGGGPLPNNYAVRFSDGGSFLGEPQPEGKLCGQGATTCTFTDIRTAPIPNRWYFAELLGPIPDRSGIVLKESTYQKNRVYVDWIKPEPQG